MDGGIRSHLKWVCRLYFKELLVQVYKTCIVWKNFHTVVKCKCGFGLGFPSNIRVKIQQNKCYLTRSCDKRMVHLRRKTKQCNSENKTCKPYFTDKRCGGCHIWLQRSTLVKDGWCHKAALRFDSVNQSPVIDCLVIR